MTLVAGILIPFVIGFTDIVLRNAVSGMLEQPYLTLVSFAVLGGGYILGFRALWHWLAGMHRFDKPFTLLRLSTVGVIISSIVQFIFLFQPENLVSNAVWLAFFTVTCSFFYLIGRLQLNRY